MTSDNKQHGMFVVCFNLYISAEFRYFVKFTHLGYPVYKLIKTGTCAMRTMKLTIKKSNPPTALEF